MNLVNAGGDTVPADSIEITFRYLGIWTTCVLELDTLRVRDWPAGLVEVIDVPVGSMLLCRLLRGPDLLATRWSGPVPACLPGGPSETVTMHVDADGSIEAWGPQPADVAEAFEL